MRICSFLPSATEMLFALGLGDSISGVTFECDFPQEAAQKPVVVRSRLAHSTDSQEIDRQVSEFVGRGESLYRIEGDLLREIQPDLIVTQDLCHVCAASPDDLASTLTTLTRQPAVLSLNPRTLEEVWNDILTVGRAADRSGAATKMVDSIRGRMSAVERSVAGATAKPRVLCLEWMNPPFIGGHWVPEMVARAGGVDALGRAGEPSRRVEWKAILDAAPEVVVVMACGYHLKETIEEFRKLQLPAGWSELPAAVNGRVFAVDGSSYYSRPGPRLAEGVEILAHLLHPERVPAPDLHEAFAPLN